MLERSLIFVLTAYAVFATKTNMKGSAAPISVFPFSLISMNKKTNQKRKKRAKNCCRKCVKF
jgi:hypothetical protein